MAVVKAQFPPPFEVIMLEDEVWPETELLPLDERPDLRRIDYLMIGETIIELH